MNSFEASNGGIGLTELVAMAQDSFNTQIDAAGWMNTPHPLLDGMSPRDAAQTQAGAKRVAEILTAIKWGGVV
jgi:uncharacterized protein (DUF2384 family)